MYGDRCLEKCYYLEGLYIIYIYLRRRRKNEQAQAIKKRLTKGDEEKIKEENAEKSQREKTNNGMSKR